MYSRTSEERTLWEQAFCPLFGGCPYLGGSLIFPPFSEIFIMVRMRAFTVFLFVRCFIHSRLAPSQAPRLLRRSSLTSVVLDIFVIHMYMHTLYAGYAHSNVLYTLNARALAPGPIILWVWFLSVRDSFALKNRIGSISFVRCPESRSVRLSEVGFVYTKAVVISIRATDFVRCREVVLLSEGGSTVHVHVYASASNLFFFSNCHQSLSLLSSFPLLSFLFHLLTFRRTLDFIVHLLTCFVLHTCTC